jgi:CheY-like chemotaxis protein
MKKQVLILDDSEIVGNLTAFILDKHNVKSVVFTKGVEALNYLTDEENPYPSLIIIDHYLSTINAVRRTGLMVLKALHKYGADIPVIVLSGVTDVRIKQKYLDIGVSDFVSKNDIDFMDSGKKVDKKQGITR